MLRRELTAAEKIDGQFYWLRITSFNAGATIRIDGGPIITVDARLAYPSKYPNSKPWTRIDTTGTLNIEVGDTPEEPYPGPVSA